MLPHTLTTGVGGGRGGGGEGTLKGPSTPHGICCVLSIGGIMIYCPLQDRYLLPFPECSTV